MKLQHQLLLIIICCGLSAAADPSYISINCGGAAAAAGLGGRQWLRDAAAKGSSAAASTVNPVVVDQVPYKTARISVSQFTYSFHVNPGQKLVRLHFNPASYTGFQNSNDFFTVEAGPYTLLSNFSASITARALAANVIVREFCVIIRERQYLDIVFSPETSQPKYYKNYAFVNGIEIISVPSTISYCDGGEGGIHVLGQKYAIHLDNSTALEMVHRQNIKWGSDDGVFGMWASSLKEKATKACKRIWRVPVDVGFRYFVRLHLCELGLKIHKDFKLLIDDMIALASPDMLHKNGKQLWYNYMVMVEGQKREGKRNISITLNSQHDYLDRHGPFEGFEVFKLSNHDRSLASPNPVPPSSKPAIPTTTLHSGLIITTVVITVLCAASITNLLHRKQVVPTNDTEEDNKQSGCRRFPLAEILKATENFHEGLLLGEGGFGKVYRGKMDNGRKLVAIKRLKPDSKQGQPEFWTEIETLSGLLHGNIVPFIGYCKEQDEMILVYEYMPCGTLADHLYKKKKYYPPLSWTQRLNICIGASQGIHYLHTGGQGIIHRDVKSSNILLDDELLAKVSDFGLAKSGTNSSDSQSQDSTKLKGTFGYIDPNFYKTHKLTRESDTYSFGVVLLEVVTDKPAVEKLNEEDKRILTTWAEDNIDKGQFDLIVGSTLRGKISPDSLKTFGEVTKTCLLGDPKKRPGMAHVIIALELALEQQKRADRDGFEDVYSLPHKGNEITNAVSGKVQTHTPFPGEQSNAIIRTGKSERATTWRNILQKHVVYKKPTDKTSNIALPVKG